MSYETTHPFRRFNRHELNTPKGRMLEGKTTPAERLRWARKQLNLTSAELAGLVGISDSAVRAHENGQNNILPPAAEAYAKALNTTPEYLLFGTLNRTTRTIPVLGQVQAGAWLEQLDVEPEPTDYIPFWDPAYARAENVWALTVAGPSMNMFYPPGTMVIVVDASEAGVREGDHVVARRHRNGMVEASLKEVVYNPDQRRVELWPRSTDPNFQKPILLGDDVDEAQIQAVVVGTYRKMPRTGALL